MKIFKFSINHSVIIKLIIVFINFTLLHCNEHKFLLENRDCELEFYINKSETFLRIIYTNRLSIEKTVYKTGFFERFVYLLISPNGRTIGIKSYNSFLKKWKITSIYIEKNFLTTESTCDKELFMKVINSWVEVITLDPAKIKTVLK